jgi:hypothetical protein
MREKLKSARRFFWAGAIIYAERCACDAPLAPTPILPQKGREKNHQAGMQFPYFLCDVSSVFLESLGFDELAVRPESLGLGDGLAVWPALLVEPVVCPELLGWRGWLIVSGELPGLGGVLAVCPESLGLGDGLAVWPELPAVCGGLAVWLGGPCLSRGPCSALDCRASPRI